mgnify:CR=1 FL=1
MNKGRILKICASGLFVVTQTACSVRKGQYSFDFWPDVGRDHISFDIHWNLPNGSSGLNGYRLVRNFDTGELSWSYKPINGPVEKTILIEGKARGPER